MKLLFRISRFLLRVPNDTGLFLTSILEALNVVLIILQETKKTSADFIQDQLKSMIPNPETIYSVKTEENLSLPNTETISSVNTEENPSVPHIVNNHL
jgi:hypothetical protein